MAENIGYAVIGAGLVGPTHARFAAQARGATPRVVCDLREDRGRPLAEELAGWRGTWNLEGGVDLMTWIAGPIRRVQGYSRHLRHAIEGDDTTIVVCQYESGALGVIECTTSVYLRQLDRIDLHGERGTILIEDYHIKDWQIEGVEMGGPTAEELALPGAERGTSVGHFLQIQDMIEAICEGREPVVRGEDALHSLAVIQAISQAERTGRAVEVRHPAAV